MGIYRGPGGTGDAVNDASSEARITVQARDDALAAQAAAEAAKTAAELAQTNAETAETNAELAEANAELAETNAEAAQAAAEAAQLAAEAAQTAAELAETNAETAETNAEAAADLAQDWAIKTSAPVSGSEYSSKYHALAAASSASAASTSASNAASSASAASTSASNAANSASAAATTYDEFDDRYLGAKSSNPTTDNDGNALITGALYFNTAVPEIRVWTGSVWNPISAGGAVVSSFNTRNGDVTLTSTDVTDALTYTPLSPSVIGSTVQAYDADTTKNDVSNTFTQPQVFPAGTVSAPAITTTGDTNTGIFFPAADTIAFAEGGVESMRINSSGNVGIGTSSPFYRLDVSGSNASDFRGFGVFNTSTNSASQSSISFHTANDGTADRTRAVLAAFASATGNDGVFTISTRNAGTVAERMRIDSTGNLGLGVTPSAWDTVYKSAELGSVGMGIAGFVGGTQTVINGNAYYNAGWKYARNTASAQLSVDNTGFKFNLAGTGTAGNAITFTQAMTLDASGNLGIGTSSPQALLDVSSATGGIIRITSSDTTISAGGELIGGIQFVSSDASVGGAGVTAAIATYSAAGYTGGGRPSYMTFDTSDSSGQFERMRINSSGNVGIGTSSPSTQLHVKGTWVTNEGIFQIDADSGTQFSGMTIQNNGTIKVTAYHDNTAGTFSTGTTAAEPYILLTNNTERMRITSGGEVLVGGTTALNSSDGGISIQRSNATPFLYLYRNDTTVASPDQLGSIGFYGNDTTSNTPTQLAYVNAIASGTHAAGDNPTDLVFGTTPDGSATVAEAMRLNSEKNLGLATSPSAWGSSFTGFDFGGRGTLSYNLNSANVGLAVNAYNNGTNWIYKATAAASVYQQEAGGHFWYTAPSGTAGTAITFTERMRITNDGYLRMASGSLGIQFNGDTAAANALDDYEEGTFTPTIVGTTTAGTGTYVANSQIGRYTKIGNRVFFQLYLNWTAHTGTGSTRINGLPFTSANVTNDFSTITIRPNNYAMTASNYMVAYVGVNSTTIVIEQTPVGGGAITEIPIDTSASLMVAGHYYV